MTNDELTAADLEVTLSSLEHRGAIKRSTVLGSPSIQLTSWGRELEGGRVTGAAISAEELTAKDLERVGWATTTWRDLPHSQRTTEGFLILVAWLRSEHESERQEEEG